MPDIPSREALAELTNAVEAVLPQAIIGFSRHLADGQIHGSVCGRGEEQGCENQSRSRCNFRFSILDFGLQACRCIPHPKSKIQNPKSSHERSFLP